MKKLLIYSGILLAGLQVGCTKGFEELNVNPLATSPDKFDAAYFLPSAQRDYLGTMSGYSGSLLFQSGWVQLLASTSTGGATYYSNMDKYVPSSNINSYTANSWGASYTGATKAQELIKRLSGDPTKVNLVSAATIVKVMNMAFITDLYGPLPYSEALQGDKGVNTPKYDNQHDIYVGLLTELESAVNGFSTSQPAFTNDISTYQGDITKWKKLGYSLMLRMAMRLTKVDAGLAQQWAEKAIAGGPMSSVADDYVLKCDFANGYGNPNSSAIRVTDDFYQVRWSKTFIDYLKANNDPRLSLIAEVPPAGISGASDITQTGDNTAANQLGLPNGYDMSEGPTDISTAPGYPGGTGTGGDFSPIGKYSRPSAAMTTNLNAPVVAMTYAETSLLMAEAAVRGWNVSGTAAQHYQNGVSAALQTLAVFGPATTISAGDADTYAAAHPLDVSSTGASLKMINEQYWATTGSYFSFVEAWNNWRRTGIPNLTPISFTGSFSNGQIPRRQIFPLNEATLNGDSYQAGLSDIQGGDNWTGRVWWDASN
jgi:hypothetical protein